MDASSPRRTLDSVPDSLIAARAVDGDVDAFAALVRRYAPKLRAYVRSMLASTAELDDVVQETFVTAWQQLSTLREPAHVRSWLYQIASRKAIDRIRQRAPQLDIDELAEAIPAPTSPERAVEARAGIAELREALAALPEAQRQCWVLRELGGSSYDEIAEHLSVPVTTVRGLLARARKGILVRMEGWR